MRHLQLKHQFVHYIPERLEPGVLYVAVDYATAVHSCCCGCGQEVVTPLSPSGGWKLIFDGETVSLSPSIGNRNFECRSHYFIERNQVIEAKDFTRQYSVDEGIDADAKEVFGTEKDANRTETLGPWSRVKAWVAKGKRLRSRNRRLAENGAGKRASKRSRPKRNAKEVT